MHKVTDFCIAVLVFTIFMIVGTLDRLTRNNGAKA